MHTPTVAPSERSFNPQTVCVWLSGVMAARGLNPAIPGTVAEVLALAADSGVLGDLWKRSGQANFTKLNAGMTKRYGFSGRVIEGPACQLAVLEAAAAGPIVACVAGRLLNLTPHYQTTDVGHAIAVLYEHGTTGLQFDPLAPEGYAGDPFPPAELAKFATAALIFKEGSVASVKAAGSPLGTFRFNGPGHALIDTSDTHRHIRAWPGGGDTFAVYAVLELKTHDGTPVDIEGNSPPLDHRDELYLVDRPEFGAACYVLRQDGTYTPAATAGHTAAELGQAARDAAADVAAAAADRAKLYVS